MAVKRMRSRAAWRREQLLREWSTRLDELEAYHLAPANYRTFLEGLKAVVEAKLSKGGK